MDTNYMDDKKLIPLKALRKVLEMSSKEFAEKFKCTKAYITAIEKGDRVMSVQMLGYGLMRLGITEKQYKELDDFYQKLLSDELNKPEFTKLMLFKTYSVLAKNEEEKNQIEALINVILKNNKARK